MSCDAQIPKDRPEPRQLPQPVYPSKPEWGDDDLVPQKSCPKPVSGELNGERR
jgi:hypothetical protein